jgi:hypothetical protein
LLDPPIDAPPVDRESGDGDGALGQLPFYLDKMLPKTIGQPLVGGPSSITTQNHSS